LTKEARRHFSPVERASLENRDKRDLDEIERSNHPEEFSCSLPGRQSGSKEWRISRAELGADNNINMSSEHYSCPFRICIDDHVGKIYKSFGLILCQCIDRVKSIPRVMDELKALQNFLLELSATPFRTRKITIDSKSNMLALSEVLESDAYKSLFQSLSLKNCLDETGKRFVCLGGEPVMTSLALPVAVDILKEMVNDAGSDKNLTDNPAVKVFSNCTRVCFGSVQASGEQVPLGIVSFVTFSKE
jgi:peptide-N4-(N-acetyl-beta-glucosaminyl)asparagine amidase